MVGATSVGAKQDGDESCPYVTSPILFLKIHQGSWQRLMPIVYSTDSDERSTPAKPARANAERHDPNKPPPKDPPAKGQVARIWRDSKRRKGKTVTVVGGLRHDPATLEKLCADLKKHCSAGGTVKAGEIEIQGDHRERVAARLQALGYKTKFAGG